MLQKMKPQEDLPPGDTFQCLDCGARVRTGEIHSALSPRPHRSLDMLFVEMTKEELAADINDGIRIEFREFVGMGTDYPPTATRAEAGLTKSIVGGRGRNLYRHVA